MAEGKRPRESDGEADPAPEDRVIGYSLECNESGCSAVTEVSAQALLATASTDADQPIMFSAAFGAELVRSIAQMEMSAVFLAGLMLQGNPAAVGKMRDACSTVRDGGGEKRLSVVDGVLLEAVVPQILRWVLCGHGGTEHAMPTRSRVTNMCACPRVCAGLRALARP